MEFGKFLSQLRRERSVYQKELAKYLNVTVATISNYEKGVHSPDIYTLVKIADFFDVSTDYLLQRTTYKLTINTLNARLTGDYTMSDLMNTTLELDDHNMDALIDYYELLKLRNSVNQKKKRKGGDEVRKKRKIEN